MEVRPNPTSCEPPLVGFEVDKSKIMNAMLDTSEQRLSFLDIVGPRGVGKTYLAKEIYTSPKVQKHFEVHVWLSFANCLFQKWPKYCMRVQLSIWDRADVSIFLRDKRYCVVIDDPNGDIPTHGMAWSSILRELPDNNNGSRVLVVTRRPEYPECTDPIPISNLMYEVGRRNNKESLEMLKAAFSKDPWEGCPAGEVDDLMMKFVSKCEGLPWPLRFLGGLLSERPWKEVLGRIEAIEAAGMSFVKFAMSYRDLPDYKHKACFLYFLTFPEDAEIHTDPRLRMMKVAESTLENLARRSMIEVTKRNSDDSIKCCRLRDPFLRLLAIHEAKEKRYVPLIDDSIAEYLVNRSVRFVPVSNYSMVDLFDARIEFSPCLPHNRKSGGKFMGVAQLADASCIFNFGENLPLETALISSDRLLEIDYSKVSFWSHHTTLFVRDTTMETLQSIELLKMMSLEHLLLTNTKIREIPNIPESLETLDVGDTPIETLPVGIGSSKLIILRLRNTKVRQIPKLPESLKTLDVGDTPIEILPEWTGSSKLIILRLRNTKVRQIPKLPESLKTLDVGDTPIEILPEWTGSSKLIILILRNTKVSQIPKLPESLETLDMKGTPIEILPEWIGSSKLSTLILRNTKVREIAKLPESLETLDMKGAPIEILPDASFCPNLRTIVLKNTKVHEIPESYTRLKYLDARNTFLQSLPYSLWSNLKSVLATDTLQHLDGPPTSLKGNNRITNFGRRLTPNYDHLETLEIVRVTKDWAKSIPRFRSMKKLGLSYFQNDFTPDNALDWTIITRILEDLHNLSSLKIQGSNIPAEIINVQTCPSYRKTLKNLSVGGSYSLFRLRGLEMPPCLITLKLDNLEFDADPMPIFGKLEKLENLELRWLLYTTQIKRMMCSNGSFPQLKRLQLTQIIGLEELSVEEGALPKIEDVVVESCIDLKDLFVPFSILADPPKGLTHACFANWTYKRVL